MTTIAKRRSTPLPPLGKTTAPKPKTTKPIYNPSAYLQSTKEGKAYLSSIRKMEPYERLIYWITERHRIHNKRFPDGFYMHDDGLPSCPEGAAAAGPPVQTDAPWTDDPILQTVFFCNPYRENDKVTAYLRDNFREEHKDKECAFLGTILLRMFNYIPTMYTLLKEGIPQQMDQKGALKALAKAEKLLVAQRDDGYQMFGGAYIIKFFNGVRKVEALFQIMRSLVDSKYLYKQCRTGRMSAAHEALTSFHGMGPFYCYQFIGDLAYTHVLKAADDWWTWGFCGPGTSRGLLRLRGITTKANGKPMERRIDKPRGWEEQLLELQGKVNKTLAKQSTKKLTFPRMHMRDLCNCLCEYDKYERALNNERNIKRPYAGT
jgi:hypothetical protein